jgi:hypothetical protein
MPRTQTQLIGVRRLIELLDSTHYMVVKLRKRGVIPEPAAMIGGRECWRLSDFPKIRDSVDAYHAEIRRAEHNVRIQQLEAERAAELEKKNFFRNYGQMLAKASENI